MFTEWTNIGNISVLQAELDVDERDHVSIEALSSAKVAIYTPNPGATEAEVRFITPAEGDSWVIAMYAARGAYDNYVNTRLFQVIGGAQVHSTGKVFCDSVIYPAGNDWYGNVPKPVRIQSGTDYIVRYYFRLMGYTRFLFIAYVIEAGKILEVEVAEME